MNDNQLMHAMSLDDTYHVEQVLARGEDGITELVTIDGAGPFVRKKIRQELARRNVWSALTECSSPRLPRVEATYELPEHFVVVYDFVPGRSLSKVIETDGPLTPEEATSLGIELCEAAEELHRHGIVHRDISPNNIVVAANGAHLIDLGIARMRVEGASKDTTSLGTWGFASPEQYGFAQTDARSDVYSIGRVLGFALTGVRPDDEAYEQILKENLDNAPATLVHAITRACSFEPSARFQSATEMAEVLAGSSRPGNDSASSGTDGQADHTQMAAGTHAPKRNLGKSRTRTFGGLLIKLALLTAMLAGLMAVGAIAISTFHAGRENDNGPTAPSQSGQPDGVSTSKKANSTSDANRLSAELSIVESGWSADDFGYVHFGIGLKNSAGSAAIEYPTVRICGYDADDNVIFTDEKTYSAIEPGQTVYFGDQTGNGTAPARVEFETVTPSGVALATATEAPVYEIFDSTESAGVDGMQSFLAKLKLQSAPSDFDKTQVFLSAILRDKQGNIVAGYNNFADCPAVGSTTPVSVDVHNPPAHASCDIYAAQW
ncbi:serine/threonine protein kinase [Collinsella aerofaciens]|uniref:serine/threonine protein kinase n=1 Tax=Collinsella aerofaciens TaxID=74426 RepID=UPI0034A51480